MVGGVCGTADSSLPSASISQVTWKTDQDPGDTDGGIFWRVQI